MFHSRMHCLKEKCKKAVILSVNVNCEEIIKSMLLLLLLHYQQLCALFS